MSDRMFGPDPDPPAGSAPPGGLDAERRAGGAPGRPDTPLAARVRPSGLAEVVGLPAELREGGALRAALDGGRLPSLLLWGPPGSGKTTLARALAAASGRRMVERSAVEAGVRQVREVAEHGRQQRARGEAAPVLFVDEVHRFSSAQQDALLPSVEEGDVVLVAATTEHPGVHLTPPLRSRLRVVRLERHGEAELRELCERALRDAHGLPGLEVDPEALEAVAGAADGDARAALGLLEAAAVHAGWSPQQPARVGLEQVRAAWQGGLPAHGRRGDAHFDQASALIKAVRGSDPDAAVYWLVRMLAAGEDPRFVARRLVISAGEDVGLADPRALQVAVAAQQALEAVGLPEARYALAEAAIYLAAAPKSDTVTRALAAADAAVREHGQLPVPAHLRDAHHAASRALGHGEGYRYPHRWPGGWVEQRYLPEPLRPGDVVAPLEDREEGEEAATFRRLRRRRGEPSDRRPPEGS